MRDSVIFYRSFYEAIKELPVEMQSEVYSAIFEYSLNFDEVVLSGLPKAIFTLIKPQLDANNKRYENGKKGGRTNQKESEPEPSSNQNITKVHPNVNDNVNGNVNENVNKFDDDAHAENFRQKENAKTFLIEKKQIQMDRLKMKYKFTQDQLHLKIDEFIEKKFDWGDNTWRDENEMSKNFELWLDKNRTVIINPYKSWNEEEFKAECQKHKKEFGAKVLTDFFRYWNQQTETGVMRFQEKNAWNTEQQLKIWKSKNGK